jgi:tetratricopeptide (TPR) repeat protein
MKLRALVRFAFVAAALAAGCSSEGDRKGDAPPPSVANKPANVKEVGEDENDPVVRANRLHQAGNLDAAIVEVKKGLELDPDDAFARYLYANFLEEKGELRGAAEQFRLTLTIKPKEKPKEGDVAPKPHGQVFPFICWRRLGEVLERLGEMPAALDAYLKAIDSEREVQAKLAATEKGSKAFASHYGLPTGSAEPWRDLARVYLYLGETDKALEAIGQARSRSPRDPFTERLAVKAFQRAGDQDHAVECARRFIDEAGEDPTFIEWTREMRELVRRAAPPLALGDRKILVDYVRTATRFHIPGANPEEDFFTQTSSERLVRSDDRAVFVSLIPAKGPRLRGRGRGRSLAAAIRGAVETIASSPRFDPTALAGAAVRIDIEKGELEPIELSPVERHLPDEPSYQTLQAKPPVEPGLHGIAVRVDERELFCLPGDAVTEDLRDVKAMLEFASREGGFAAHAWESSASRVFRFQTESFCSAAPGTAPLDLVRGEPFPFPEAFADTVLEPVTLAADWLMRDLVLEERPASEAGASPQTSRWLKERLPSGEVAIVQTLTFARFHADYRARTDTFGQAASPPELSSKRDERAGDRDPSPRPASPLDEASPNELRHAAAALALADTFLRTGRSEYRDGAELLARWLEDRAQEEEGGRVVIVVDKNARLGTQALALALEEALAQAAPQDDPLRASFRDGLARTLVAAMREDGTFTPLVAARGTVQPRDAEARDYGSQAILALVRHHKATGDRRWLEAAQKGVDARIRDFRQRSKEGSQPIDSWLARAISELDEVEGLDEAQKDRRAFALEIAQAVVGRQARPERLDASGGIVPEGESFPSGLLTARLGGGLTAVALMAHREALKESKDLRDASRAAASFALRHQYTSRNTFYLPNPDRSRGAFRSSLHDSRIRIDVVADDIELLLLVERLLRE